MVGSGCGSFFGRGRFDGFPSKILSFVGFFGGPDTKITSYPICASIFSYIFVKRHSNENRSVEKLA